ncbi:hypothetical protein ABKN59_007401 [Abortiporus biennis]
MHLNVTQFHGPAKPHLLPTSTFNFPNSTNPDTTITESNSAPAATSSSLLSTNSSIIMLSHITASNTISSQFRPNYQQYSWIPPSTQSNSATTPLIVSSPTPSQQTNPSASTISPIHETTGKPTVAGAVDANKPPSKSFLNNKSAVAGVFATIGLIFLIVIIALVKIALKRRAKASDDATEAHLTTANSTSLGFNRDDDDDGAYRADYRDLILIGMKRDLSDLSHATYAQPPTVHKTVDIGAKATNYYDIASRGSSQYQCELRQAEGATMSGSPGAVTGVAGLRKESDPSSYSSSNARRGAQEGNEYVHRGRDEITALLEAAGLNRPPSSLAEDGSSSAPFNRCSSIHRPDSYCSQYEPLRHRRDSFSFASSQGGSITDNDKDPFDGLEHGFFSVVSKNVFSSWTPKMNTTRGTILAFGASKALT